MYLMAAIRSARWAAIVVALPLAIVLAAVAAHSANPNALREIVDGQCVPDMQQHADPKPCAEVDLTGGVPRGFAILKDIKGASQFLLIPTDVIDGIESPALLAPDVVNYFDDAWTARTLVEKALGRTMPRDALSLAINSKYGRTQNQLHIHIDCIAADVRDSLRNQRDRIGDQWRLLDTPLAGHRYYARRVLGGTLAGQDPFKLVAQDIRGADADMALYTIVVAGMDFDAGKPGFVILARRADLAGGDVGSGEELQDHSCALAK
jgi:CDP-diacylglycerol pyrophosphatase